MYINSENIKVFPCASRGNNSNGKLIPYDPESRLNTEFNVRATGYLRLGEIYGKNTYVISKTNDKFIFVHNGYYFEISNPNYGNLRYCKVNINNANIFIGPDTSITAESEFLKSVNTADTDTYLDNNNEFVGIDFKDKLTEGYTQLLDDTDELISEVLLPKITYSTDANTKKLLLLEDIEVLKIYPDTTTINDPDISFESGDKLNVKLNAGHELKYTNNEFKVNENFIINDIDTDSPTINLNNNTTINGDTAINGNVTINNANTLNVATIKSNIEYDGQKRIWFKTDNDTDAAVIISNKDKDAAKGTGTLDVRGGISATHKCYFENDIAINAAKELKLGNITSSAKELVIRGLKDPAETNSIKFQTYIMDWSQITGVTGGYNDAVVIHQARTGAAFGDGNTGTLEVKGGIKSTGDSNYFESDITTGGNLTVTGSSTFTGEITAKTVKASGKITAQSFYANSDRRLKENIIDYIPKKSILDLPVKQYNYIGRNDTTIGCIAQDLQEICPELVRENDKGYLSIEESKLVYLLLDEVKKLKQEVDELKKVK